MVKLEKALHEEENRGTYSYPNWAYLQADNRGYRRALREISKLVYGDKEHDI